MIKYSMIMFGSVLVASISQVLLKKSANKEHKSIINEYLNIFVILGYSLMFVSSLLGVLSYTGLELKYGSIIESLAYIIMLVFGKLFFNEKITKNKIIGNLLIVVGVIIFCI